VGASVGDAVGATVGVTVGTAYIETVRATEGAISRYLCHHQSHSAQKKQKTKTGKIPSKGALTTMGLGDLSARQ
jgi:hypothetical protein